MTCGFCWFHNYFDDTLCKWEQYQTLESQNQKLISLASSAATTPAFSLIAIACNGDGELSVHPHEKGY